MYPHATCAWCQRPFEPLKKWQRDSVKQGENVYCCPEHGKHARSVASSKTMASTNQKYASARMTTRNPMHVEETRRKVSQALKGRVPSVRGGNGKPLSVPHQALLRRLNWSPEYVIRTHAKRGSGLPTHYKVDIANPEMLIAIEVDGATHQTIKVQTADKQKTAFLLSRGWTVLRFSNQEVMEHLEDCVRTVLSTTLK
jgi:hypothetical protein